MASTQIASEALRISTASLGGSALSRAVQSGAVPVSWHTGHPNSPSAWRTHAAHVRSSPADWLTALKPAFGLAARSVASARLAEAAAHGVVVTTGQQPGLFGGPAYTLTKALSALALANVLRDTLGMPVAPVFWAATDDADWHEAAVTHVIGDAGVDRLSLRGPATDGVAMADVPLGDLRDQRAVLRAACGSVADPMVLDLIDAAYDEQSTVGGAYVAWLRSMLEPLGIAVLDASHTAVRTASHTFLSHALHHASAVDLALRDRNAAIVAHEFAPQVEAVDGLSLVFETVNGARTRVPLDRATHTADHATPGSLGANVLLRPVLERALLPTVSYVAGPGELAYFAQVSAVADALHTPLPVAVPRWSAQWREARIDRVLDRLGVDAAELREPHVVQSRLARAAMDRDVTDAMERLRVTITAQQSALAQAVSAAGSLVPPTVVQGLARDLEHRVARVERRLLAAVKSRETNTARDLALAGAALYPLGRSPERVLSLVPTLARYGLGVLSDMTDLAAEHARTLVGGPESPAA